MIRQDFTRIFRRGLSVILAGFACTFSYASTDKPVITLDPPVGQDVSAQSLTMRGALKAQAPANFRDLGQATVGEPANVEALTLRFSAETKLTNISSTPDFVVEQGSSCVEGNVYSADDTCRLLVRFTPQGAGHRLGKLTISHSASVTPAYVGLGGNGYSPVVSFTPALITTIPASVSGGAGVIKGSSSLSVDGGDTLYVADTGNNLIRSLDSSGKFRTVSSGTLSAPYSVVADNFGEIFFDEPAQNAIFEIFDYGSQFQLGGAGSDNCTTTTTCSINSEKIYLPGQMSIDPNNAIFMVEQLRGAMVAYAQPYPAQIARLYDPFTFQNVHQGTIAVDAYDNIYSLWSITNVCQILSEYFSDAANSHQVYKKVAGGKTCGYSGDGGQARNAEIGSVIPQMTFDVAGNLYFADSSNQRVRRIDASTGIIRTIAGNGTIGNGGDGGQATSATLHSPSGVAVDSQGQVYVLSNSASTGTNQVIRKLGPNGIDTFGSVMKGSSLSKIVNMANTGNSALNLTNVKFTGTNASDFSLDSTTTTCNMAAGGSLANGQSCQIGIIFKPGAAGDRSANLVLLDNTVTNFNTVVLTGRGTLPAAVVKITAPASGASFTSGSTVKFSVSVTSATGSAPTGKVTFQVDGATFGSAVALSAGVASVNLTGLTVKTHTISATYNGDGNYAASTVSESITVKSSSAVTSGPIGGPVRSKLEPAQ